MVNQKVKAFGFLLGAGMLSGFILTSGSARWLNKPKPMLAAAQEEPAQDSGQQGGSGDQKKKKRGGIEHEEGNASGGATQGGKTKARPAADKPDQGDGGDHGDTDMAEEKAPPPKQPPATGGRLSGDQAVTFLAGNTMKLVGLETKTFAYVSHSGWKGDLTDNDLVIHRLVAGRGQLCEVGTNEGLQCHSLWVDAEPKPRPDPGAKLGTVTVLGGKTWTLLRGNVASIPEFIPLLDARMKPVNRPVPKLASATGKEAMSALFQHALVAEGGPAGLRGYVYDPDGRWIEMMPLRPGAKDGLAGVKVQIGHWSYAKDTLCLDPPGLEFDRKCFKPEQWGEGAFMLVPSLKGPPSKLLVLAKNDAT